MNKTFQKKRKFLCVSALQITVGGPTHDTTHCTVCTKPIIKNNIEEVHFISSHHYIKKQAAGYSKSEICK